MFLNLNIFVQSEHFINNCEWTEKNKKRCICENSEKANGNFSVDWHSLSELSFTYIVIYSKS